METSRASPPLPLLTRARPSHAATCQNLHFAFVVLLRAVRRASPFLSTYDYTLGAATGLASRVDSEAISSGGANGMREPSPTLGSHGGCCN